ncbi:hypothetical protein BST95_13930 [Halioglobus japonicus]|nr:hypothetical protein BST95_13930 [Halioglobus japonicus]
MTLKPLFCILSLVLYLCAFEAHAHRKTDIIHFYNGDKLTGEIVSLMGGILKVSTDAMGTVQIEWPEIARMESEYHYEVRVTNGDRIYGSFSDKARPGQVLVTDVFARHQLESLAIVEIRPIEDSWVDRLNIHLSGTYGYTRASGVTQLAFNTEISYENERSRNTLTGQVDISDTNEGSTSSKRLNFQRAVWPGNRSDQFRTGFVNYEDNDELELDYRVAVGGGTGRYFIDTNRSRLTGAGGLQVITEKGFSDGSNEDIEGFLNVSYSTWKFSTPELHVDLNFTLYPSLTDAGRLRSYSNARISWEIIEDLSWDITAWATSDNNVEDNVSYWDYSITTGIGWDF